MQETSPRKKIVIILVLVVLLLLIVTGYVLLRKGSLPEGESLTMRNLFPFSSGPSTPIAPPLDGAPLPDEEVPLTSPIVTTQSDRLRKITQYPVTGFISFIENETFQEPKLDEKTGETVFVPIVRPSLIIRFNAKQNGIISDARITPEAITVEQKTITSIPLVEELWFFEKGVSALFRTWNTLDESIETMLGTITPSESNEFFDVGARFLPENILRGTISPDKKRFFAVRRNSEQTIGIVGDSSSTTLRTVFTSPFSEWRPQWASRELITMTTLASRDVDGYMYGLNPETTSFRKILGPIRGLTALTAPSGKQTLLSQSTDQGIRLFTYNHQAGLSTPVAITTLPEKCVWQNETVFICAVPQLLPVSLYPDRWYQGVVSFEDSFWLIDISSGATTQLFTPEEPTDGTMLQVSPDNNYLFYVNKRDGTLWSYRLVE